MDILLLHQNFPGQYKHLAPALAARGHQVIGVGDGERLRQQPHLPGVRRVGYKSPRGAGPETHPYLQSFEGQVRRGQQVLRALQQLQRDGFRPDLILAHPGWGEALFLKDAYPDVPLIGLFEFYYRGHGVDMGFDPEFPLDLDQHCRARSRNANHLIALEATDVGICPTAFQKSVHPSCFHDKLRVIHDGIDTDQACPKPLASMQIMLDGQLLRLSREDEVISFVSRNLEPYRGFHVFMRALPRLLEQRPQARVVIVGEDAVSYGPAAPAGSSWKQIFLAEVQDHLDLSRVHFCGRLPYSQLLKLFQLTSAHVYLTYPFVLSWSMLEAMSCGALVVGSRTPPVEEVIRDGENGLLVDFFSPEQLASRLIDVLGHPDGFQSLREEARRTIVEHYDLRRICLPQQLALIRGVEHSSGC